MDNIDPVQLERHKQAFLSVIKWASQYSGARVVFDSDNGCPKADVNKKIIHMPRSIAIEDVDYTLGILIHEAMHIKHTPKWLSELCRDSIDHTIINGLEDERIERHACSQLRALQLFLRIAVNLVKNECDPDKIELGFKVLSNIACKASGYRIFEDTLTYNSEMKNGKLLRDLKESYERIFTVTMGKSFETNVETLYKNIDAFRSIYNLPPADPSQMGKKKQEGEGEMIGDDQGYGTNKGIGQSYEPGNNVPQINLEDLQTHLIDINAQAKERIKETLKKSLTTVINEGMILNTDNLTDLMTGNIDEVFTDTATEKKMRTKIYFLMDVSGSMNGSMEINGIGLGKQEDEVCRQELAISSFQAIAEVVDECKNSYGCDIDYDNYIFGDSCQKVENMAQRPHVGGGTNLHYAMRTVFADIQRDDPANKRLLVIMTDGDVGDPGHIEQLIKQEAQDIRVVFVGISDDQCCKLIKHNIAHKEHGEAKIVEAMEEAL